MFKKKPQAPEYPDLTGPNLTRLNLNYADFSGRDLTRFHFTGSSLVEANFTGCDLTRVNFSSCNLTGANFSDANLFRTIFNGTTTVDTIFTNTILDLSMYDFSPIILTPEGYILLKETLTIPENKLLFDTLYEIFYNRPRTSSSLKRIHEGLKSYTGEHDFTRGRSANRVLFYSRFVRHILPFITTSKDPLANGFFDLYSYLSIRVETLYDENIVRITGICSDIYLRSLPLTPEKREEMFAECDAEFKEIKRIDTRQADERAIAEQRGEILRKEWNEAYRKQRESIAPVKSELEKSYKETLKETRKDSRKETRKESRKERRKKDGSK